MKNLIAKISKYTTDSTQKCSNAKNFKEKFIKKFGKSSENFNDQNLTLKMTPFRFLLMPKKNLSKKKLKINEEKMSEMGREKLRSKRKKKFDEKKFFSIKRLIPDRSRVMEKMAANKRAAKTSREINRCPFREMIFRLWSILIKNPDTTQSAWVETVLELKQWQAARAKRSGACKGKEGPGASLSLSLLATPKPRLFLCSFKFLESRPSSGRKPQAKFCALWLAMETPLFQLRDFALCRYSYSMVTSRDR